MIFLSFLTILTSTFGQVKEQYRDTSNTSTIVVVKNDDTIDEDVLDEFFELNEMSMNDEIRITTAPDVENATADISGEEFIETNIPEAAATEVPQNKEVIRKPISVNKKAAGTKAKGSYQVKSRADVMNASARKYFKGKKKKKKKRKRGRKASKSCYAF